MDIEHHEDKGLDVLILKGRLDAAATKDFKKQVSDLTDQDRVRIVLDMRGVDFIDSSGLGSLVGALRAASNKGGDVKIASLQNQVRAIFELTRLHRVFSVFQDQESALTAFG